MNVINIFMKKSHLFKISTTSNKKQDLDARIYLEPYVFAWFYILFPIFTTDIHNSL